MRVVDRLEHWRNRLDTIEDGIRRHVLTPRHMAADNVEFYVGMPATVDADPGFAFPR